MKWAVIASGILFLVLGSLLVLWIFTPSKSVLSATSEVKALKNLLGRDPHLTTDSQSTQWIFHTNAYLSFAYPSWAKIYTVDNAKATRGDTLDSFSFSLLDEHVTATIQVVQFTGKLVEYPAVSLRRLENDIYTSSATSDAEIQFSKNQDTVEHSAFYLKNEKIVSVAVTGYNEESVENIYNNVLASLEIK